MKKTVIIGTDKGPEKVEVNVLDQQVISEHRRKARREFSIIIWTAFVMGACFGFTIGFLIYTYIQRNH